MIDPFDEWAQDNDANEPLFRLGSSVVDAMAAAVPIEPLARYFEYWLLRLQGVYDHERRMSTEARTFLETARSCSPSTFCVMSVVPLRSDQRASTS